MDNVMKYLTDEIKPLLLTIPNFEEIIPLDDARIVLNKAPFEATITQCGMDTNDIFLWYLDDGVLKSGTPELNAGDAFEPGDFQSSVFMIDLRQTFSQTTLLRISYKISSERSYDSFRVSTSPYVICNPNGNRYVDSGENNTTAFVEIESNTQYIYISYSKDSSVSSGTDHVEIYEIKHTSVSISGCDL